MPILWHNQHVFLLRPEAHASLDLRMPGKASVASKHHTHRNNVIDSATDKRNSSDFWHAYNMLSRRLAPVRDSLLVDNYNTTYTVLISKIKTRFVELMLHTTSQTCLDALMPVEIHHGHY